MRMEHQGKGLRATLTPTDIFNAGGESEVGDVSLSRAAVEAAAALVRISTGDLIAKVKERARAVIAREVLVFLLGMEGKEKALLDMWMRGDFARGVNLDLALEAPILAAGAPAALFLSPVASFLSGDCVIPPFMEVANAVGAVAGVVSHREEVIVRRQPDETYRAFVSDGRYDFQDLDSATTAAEEKASVLAKEAARAAGAGELELDHSREDFSISNQDGSEMVLERKIIVRAFGRPRMQA